LGNDWKSAISSTSGRDGIFAKSSCSDISRQSAKSEIRKTVDIETLPRIPYLLWLGPVTRTFQLKLVRQVLLATDTGKRPRGRPRARWRDYITDLACSRHGLEPAELCEITENCDVFRVVLGLLHPRVS